MGLATTPSIKLAGCLDNTNPTTAGFGVFEIPLTAAYAVSGAVVTFAHVVNSEVAKC